MPQLARETLIHQLHDSGLLEQLTGDAGILFGLRLVFSTDVESIDDARTLRQSVQVGAVELGWLTLPASKQPRRDAALSRWLGMASRELEESLLAMRSSHHKSMPATVTLAIDLIRDKYAQNLSLAEVAREVGLSREGLSRAFHHNLGVTFSSYLHQVRMDEAKRLLTENTHSVSVIAGKCGYQSLSQFNRRFKSGCGMSPSQFRRQAGSVVAPSR